MTISGMAVEGAILSDSEEGRQEIQILDDFQDLEQAKSVVPTNHISHNPWSPKQAKQAQIKAKAGARVTKATKKFEVGKK